MNETISACIASIPERRYSLESTIKSLLPQVDKIYLFLNNYDRVAAEQLYKISPKKIECAIGDNGYGDAGKFYWANKVDGFVCTADDDIVYPPDYIQSLVNGIEKYGRKAIVSFHGRILKFPTISYYRDYENYFSFSDKLECDTFVHVAGTGCMGWHSRSVNISIKDFLSANMADIHVSIMAQKYKIPVVILSHEANWITGTFSPNNSIASRTMKNDSEQTERVNNVDWKLYSMMWAKKSLPDEINPSTAYVINLSHRTDRYRAVFDECIKNNLAPIRVEAVDGKKNSSDSGSNLMKAHYGCVASHIKALELARANGREYSLIIEDDCAMSEDFNNKLKSYARQLPPEWDLLYLGGSLINTPIYRGGSLIDGNAAEKYSENLYRAKNVLTTHAYIIKNNSIPKLLEVIKSEKNKIDILFCRFQYHNNCYITYPELAWQRTGYSDIVGKVTNNIHLRYGK